MHLITSDIAATYLLDDTREVLGGVGINYILRK